MSQAEELLNSLSIVSGEESIIIGYDRKITVPDSLKRIAVQHDHNVETVRILCPRYWDGHDLSKMIIYINYVLPNNELGSYIADNVRIDEYDSTTMHFDWTISKIVTKYKGNITLHVCARQVDSEGNEEIHWNSEINKDMYVSEGLECVDPIAEQYPDIITQMIMRIGKGEGNVCDDVSNDAIIAGSYNNVTSSPGAIVGGYSNTVKNSVSAIVSGGAINGEDGNRASGASHSIVQGIRNVIRGTYSILFGRDNELNSNGSIIAGVKNFLTLNGHFSAIFGVGHYVDEQYRFRAGRYSETNNDIFSVGIGIDEGRRENAFAINEEGNIKATKDLTIGGKIVNKELSDKLAEIEKDIPSFKFSIGGFGQPNSISGVTLTNGDEWDLGDTYAREQVRAVNNSINGIRQKVNGFDVTIGQIDTVLNNIIAIQNELIGVEEGGDEA